MIEKIILIENADPVIFYGTNNSNIQTIKNLFPKIRIVARGNAIKALGEESDIADFEEVMEKLEAYCAKYNSLKEEVVIDFIKGKSPQKQDEQDLIIYGVSGKPIVARTPNQQKLVHAYEKNDLLFAIGPAGSGKTYTAIALAVRALKNKEVRKIILSRPAVEAGEKLGFLPGDMKEKIDPYLQPLYDALQDMIPSAKLKEFLENGTIQIAPLAFMRGRTLNDAFVILDEAQNTTVQQIKMFLTRMGMNSKIVVTGDASQIDLPPSVRSGLIDALDVLRSVKGIAKIEFNVKDIVRHKLVQRIVDAYDDRDKKRKAMKQATPLVDEREAHE
ncbi:MAG: PhoH family protein [Paludibacteraceae bacterium]|nr:PhoH family protein [Paludibacteraceae bacterium]